MTVSPDWRLLLVENQGQSFQSLTSPLSLISLRASLPSTNRRLPRGKSVSSTAFTLRKVLRYLSIGTPSISQSLLPDPGTRGSRAS